MLAYKNDGGGGTPNPVSRWHGKNGGGTAAVAVHRSATSILTYIKRVFI